MSRTPSTNERAALTSISDVRIKSYVITKAHATEAFGPFVTTFADEYRFNEEGVAYGDGTYVSLPPKRSRNFGTAESRGRLIQ